MRKTWATSDHSGLDLHLPLGRNRRAELEAALREAVRSGRLVAGQRMPPTRALAGDLGLARTRSLPLTLSL
jgi:GntR family transcriptional regulator / MocR family aminotransferase